MKTTTYKLDAIIDFIDGDRGKNYPKDQDFYESGYCLFLDASNITKDGVNFSSTHFITRDKDNQLRNGRIATDDLILTTRGTVGNIAPANKILNQYSCARVNSGMLVLRKKSPIDTNYLYYLLKSNYVQQSFFLFSSGSAQPQLPVKDLKKIKLDLPSIEQQSRIAAILSAYDELIEKNNHKISILQEQAQELYKEWFVRFRFPGHETAKFENGLPEGWRVQTLGLVAAINEKSIGKDFSHSVIKYIDIASVSRGNVGSKTEYDLCDAPGRAKRMISDGDIIWGMVRPNLKAYALILSPNPNDIVSTGFAILTAKAVPYTYLYQIVTRPHFIEYLTYRAGGSAYPAVTPKDFTRAAVILPSAILLNLYHSIVEPIYRSIHSLAENSQNLTRQRDLLLPRLMSGKLEVD